MIGPKCSSRLADLRFFQGKQRIVGASCGLFASHISDWLEDVEDAMKCFLASKRFFRQKDGSMKIEERYFKYFFYFNTLSLCLTSCCIINPEMHTSF